jgi:hypothetical protein
LRFHQCAVTKDDAILGNISGSHGGEYKDERLMGYSVVYIDVSEVRTATINTAMDAYLESSPC